jgi:hypothetical protein
MDEDKHDDVMIERDHPQTRKGEPDARGSAEWREDVVDPENSGERSEEQRAEQGDQPIWKTGEEEDAREHALNAEKRGSGETETVAELADEAEAVRKQAVGARTGGEALGSGAGRNVGSGTPGDKGDLGGRSPDTGVASKE